MDNNVSIPEALSISSVQSYIQSLPYKCESVDEMDRHLERIVGKIFVLASAKYWVLLTTWDAALQCWLELRYPIRRDLRAKLVKLYYELCLLPGIEARITRGWAEMVKRLISNKPGLRRKLEVLDLQLDWYPLWNVLKKEIFPKRRVADHNRNVVNILLFVAEQCARYFGSDSIPAMLDEFLPMLTKDSDQTVLVVVPLLTSFLPPTHTHLYIPVLMKLWEAFNSSIIDDRLLDLIGELAEEHVAGQGTEGDAQWKDIGLWTTTEWNFIVGKGFNAMGVPIGSTRFSAATAGSADALSDRNALRLNKGMNRCHSLAKLLVYSISLDGPIREDKQQRDSTKPGFIGGSRALDTLEQIITSTESFFHPSNTGRWSVGLTTFLHRLASEFAKRVKEEQEPDCKTPNARRLTPTMIRAFVTILRTPALLSMFAKDPVCMSLAQGALRVMSILQPKLIMPDLLERAYSGLELLNETHRTTAVLSTLSGVALPLVSEKIWLGGQKHIVPLLELSLPGIDVNDPVKTICTTMFIIAVVQHIKIGDLSGVPGMSMDGDVGDDGEAEDEPPYPDGTEGFAILSREEERILVRDSSASFADWVTALFRRVLALYENLPEEGGKKNVTGGKSEETVLKSIKSMIDVVCLHLSDQLFDLVLKLCFDYATTNAKSNAVRAFGHLIACLARVHPQKVISKFLPYCLDQIREELKHGASSKRTTGSHAAEPSDTTLHWNISILRGCLGYGGSVLLKYREQILSLLALLVDKTKSERGYSTSGHLLARIINTVAGTYALNSRFVNTDQWESEDFDKIHNLHWGHMYKPEEVRVEWHVPTPEEIDFVLEILDKVISPCMSTLESLLETTPRWQTEDRNDFCRFLNITKSFWSGLPTLFLEQPKKVVNPCLVEEFEIQELLVVPLRVAAGFVLTDPSDPRHVKVVAARRSFMELVGHASEVLRKNIGSEDHTDAVVSVIRAIDVGLLEYGTTRGGYDSLRKNYKQSRDINKLWTRQKENSRFVQVKRAQLYHSSRTYMHALYRRRDAVDDKLILELVQLSLSHYLRVRRQAQTVFHSVASYYLRSTRMALPVLFEALSKGNDPDHMKGALYILRNKSIAAYSLADPVYKTNYLVALLECQHEEKPSIQKLVSEISRECGNHLVEESVHTEAYSLPTDGVIAALDSLRPEFGPALVDEGLLARAVSKGPIRGDMKQQNFASMVSSILKIATRPQTHWRYVEMALRFILATLRRDTPADAATAEFLVHNTISPQPSIRTKSQRAIEKLTAFVKIRSYSASPTELWLEQWSPPLSVQIKVNDSEPLIAWAEKKPPQDVPFIDKIPTGFLTWSKTVKAYKAPNADVDTMARFEPKSLAALEAIRSVVATDEYLDKLLQLWSQEATKNSSTVELRPDNYTYVKSLAKTFPGELLELFLSKIESLIVDSDKYRQRAGAEVLSGLLRGAKHWQPQASERLWSWTSSRLDAILAQIKPEVLYLWEGAYSYVLHSRDPRRAQPLVDWIINLPLEFQGDSAFAMTKMISLSGIMIGNLAGRFETMSDKYFSLLLDNANTPYFEIRAHMANILYYLIREWHPRYPTTQALLQACVQDDDPLLIRQTKYLDKFQKTVAELPRLREERLPPPRVSQSEYDKIGLTLLQFLWSSAHGSHAIKIFPYVVPMMPEVLRMAELNDSQDLQTFSMGVLHVLSAITPPTEMVETVIANFVEAIQSSTSWRIRRHALPALVVFFYRNLTVVPAESVKKIMSILRECLRDENVEVREMASQMLSGIVRCSQRQSIIPLKNHFLATVRAPLPPRRDPSYAEALRTLHSGILGLCALIGSFPYSVEPWMPPLTEVLAPHATDPPPISTTIRKAASEFKKTHSDTWHKDQQAFNEDQLQSLSTMLVGTSYYA